MSASDDKGRVLDSWKEIAAYFDKTERTVQNWEKSGGLPVYRVGSGPRPRVMAYAKELDEWRRRDPSNTSSKRGAGPSRRLRWSGWAIGFAIVGLFVGGVLWFDSDGFRAVPIAIDVSQTEARIMGRNGKLLWSETLPRVAVDAYEPEPYPRGQMFLIEDIDGDRSKEVVFVIRHEDRSYTDKIICWEADGRERWTFSLETIPVVEEPSGRRVFSGTYETWVHGTVRSAGKSYLVVHGRSRPYYPTQIVLLDPATGQKVGTYWHPGGVFSLKLHDLTGNGVRDILFGAINNPGKEGHGFPAFGVLEVPFRAHGKGNNVFGAANAIEKHYLLFPRPDIFPDTATVSRISVMRPDRIWLYVPFPNGYVSYGFDAAMELKEFTTTSNAKVVHDRTTAHELTEQERASWSRFQRFPTAPYGNSHAVRLVMAGQGETVADGRVPQGARSPQTGPR